MDISNKLQTIAKNQQKVYDTGYNEGSALKDKKPYLDTSKITDFRYFNQEGKRNFMLPFLDTSNGTNFFYFCNGATALEVVPHLDFSQAKQMSGAFLNCTALVNITIKPNSLKAPISFAYSPLLSNDSINSIIGCLKTTTGTVRKLTLHSDVIAKLTEEQLLTVINKGWEVG